jgi:phosphohistidine phosphatase
MKKLIFIRHGKAEEPVAEITDFERSLTTRGKVISRQMANKFREKEHKPGLLISSPAFRALETAYIFAGVYGTKPEDVIIDSSVYRMGSIKTLLEVLRQAGDDTDTVTLFGHNPAFSDLPDQLSREGCDILTKTGIVCISFDIKKWSDIKPDSGKLEYSLKPEKHL